MGTGIVRCAMIVRPALSSGGPGAHDARPGLPIPSGNAGAANIRYIGGPIAKDLP